MHNHVSIWDYFFLIGWPGLLSIAVTLAGIVYAGVIHRRRLGIFHRLALIAYSPFPLLLGLLGFSIGVDHAVTSTLHACIFDLKFGMDYFLEVIQIVHLTILETITLLFLGFILIFHEAVREQRRKQVSS